jgi:hypothetical protein
MAFEDIAGFRLVNLIHTVDISAGSGRVHIPVLVVAIQAPVRSRPDLQRRHPVRPWRHQTGFRCGHPSVSAIGVVDSYAVCIVCNVLAEHFSRASVSAELLLRCRFDNTSA